MEPEPGQILSLLSHELRSPLGVVRGYLRLLAQPGSELSDGHRQAVTAALQASDRCVDLLAQANALAQMWKSEVGLERQPLAMDELLRALPDTVRGADDRVLPVVVRDTPAANTQGDRALLQTALRSLAAAVHRAQPVAGPVSVRCRLEPIDGLDNIAIRFAPDDGSDDDGGESPLDLRRGGLGLDLALADAIVGAHGGHIRERRRADGRMTMVVWLPRSELRTKNEERRTERRP